jgi:hypothetical protein
VSAPHPCHTSCSSRPTFMFDQDNDHPKKSAEECA